MLSDKTNALADNSEGNNKNSNNIISDSESNNNTDNKGSFIKLYKNILNWEWYSDINARILFFHCLLRANWQPTNWKGIKLNAGEFITSLNHLSNESGLTLKQVRFALNKLKRTNELAHKGTSHYSIITINNWDKWQSKGQSKGQTKGRQRATDIEYKNIYNNNEEKNKNKIPTLEEIEKFCIERKNDVNAKKFYDYYAANNWKDKNGKQVLNWKLKLISTWESNTNTFNKGGEVSDEEYNPNI